MAIVAISNLEAFADKLGLSKRDLMEYVFCADQHYKTFHVRKRSGRGQRMLCAPSQRLKGIQRWILAFILRQVAVADASTAFRPGCNIVDNAKIHKGQGFVFNTDLEDFFPSITIARVVGMYRALDYPSEVAWALGRLTTCRGKLPQGAPTSPDIANILCYNLDRRMSAFCSKRGWAYTRYCDDITVSGAKGIGSYERVLYSSIKDEGFKINQSKTRIVRRNGRQSVTGLVVNEKVSAPRIHRKNVRAIFHQASVNPEKFKTRIDELEGHLSFLRMINPTFIGLEKYADQIAALRGLETA